MHPQEQQNDEQTHQLQSENAIEIGRDRTNATNEAVVACASIDMTPDNRNYDFQYDSDEDKLELEREAALFSNSPTSESKTTDWCVILLWCIAVLAIAVVFGISLLSGIYDIDADADYVNDLQQILAVPKHDYSDLQDMHRLDPYIEMLTRREESKGRPIAASCSRFYTTADFNVQHNDASSSSSSSSGNGFEDSKADMAAREMTLGAAPLVWLRPLQGLQITRIPTAGATSFQQEAANLLLRNSEPLHLQDQCFDSAAVLNYTTAVFLRSPIAHSFSLFAHCRGRYSSISSNSNSSSGTGITDDFPHNSSVPHDYFTWLQHFANLSQSPLRSKTATKATAPAAADFGCYDPRNFDSHFLSCDSDNSGLPQLHLALQNLHGVDFLGLADFYVESVCLFELLLQGRLSKRCTCSGREESLFVPSSSSDSSGNSEGGSSRESYQHRESMELRALLSAPLFEASLQLTKLDQELYSNAVLRFLCDVRLAEEYLKAKFPDEPQQHELLCPGTMTQKREELAYLRMFG